MSTASSGTTKSTIQALLRSREEQQRQDSIEGTKLESTPVEDLNGNSQEDFSYSQKLFHISDGNLYSIFSPIQGRSYGMKPSFLRKHTYTVQESSCGRKTHRRGLKFHNFLPSESLTSENTSSNWRRVHSECRLREEHGTKQITISNWSHSSPDPSKAPPTSRAPSKKYSLDSVLDSLKEKSQSRIGADSDPLSRSSQKKHRRKPVQTRRVVPYVQYLSILEEGDTLPLDLSSKCLIREERPPPTTLPDQGSKKSFRSLVRGAPPRRRHQKSAMKQRLEDTFRQNGFLVKTKQVSDGDATFCKFRQLRKYTRYYLKSLEQHLPDEFHKMWKGFLPPKTVLPPE